jgi:hypothetical protein
MADRRYELDELVNRPGTYFNPQTEVMVVVDDSTSLDQEVFNLEEFEGADWVLVTDEVPVDEDRRDELFQSFQVSYHGGNGRHVSEAAVENPDDDDLDKEDEEPEDE